MKIHRVKRNLLLTILLSFFSIAKAGFYLDGGLAYQRIDNVRGSGESDTVSTTDVIVAYSDKINLPFSLGDRQDVYTLRGKYRDASYTQFSILDYTEWQLSGDFRQYISKHWWLRYSGDYLLVDTDNSIDSLDRLSLGFENGYRLTNNILLTLGYLYRNTSFDSRDDINVSHGYSVGGQYDFGEFIAAFAKYRVDNDYIDSLGFFMPDTRIKTAQAGILLAINEHSALRLMYQRIDDENNINNVVGTDIVLRY